MHHTGVFVSYDYLFFDEVTGERKKITNFHSRINSPRHHIHYKKSRKLIKLKYSMRANARRKTGPGAGLAGRRFFPS
jgi:hypothetical protein